MSPTNRLGNWYPDEEARLDANVASAARTVTGTSAVFKVEEAESLEASLSVTAASGTSPTLNVALETRVGTGGWYQVDAFAQKTGVSEDARPFGPLGDECRWAWTIAGTTPSFTFAVNVVADN